jgi:GNAT superfamily N-acetyltransferase
MVDAVKPKVTIRGAVSGDALPLTAIAMQSKAYWPYSAAQIEAWRADLTISSEMIAALKVFVVECDEQIAGCYVLQPDAINLKSWALEHVWLLPSFIGHGIGRIMLKHAIDIAAQGGATMLTIDADPHAEAFYRACGAKTVSTIAAPIDGMPNRVRPQMMLTVSD